MAVVIDHFLPGAAVNRRVVTLNTGPLFALISGQCDGAKLDTFDRLIGFATHVFDTDAVEAGFLEGAQKFFFLKGAGNTGAPKIG